MASRTNLLLINSNRCFCSRKEKKGLDTMIFPFVHIYAAAAAAVCVCLYTVSKCKRPSCGGESRFSLLLLLSTENERIDEIFAFWRDEYKHLISVSWVCVCATDLRPSSSSSTMLCMWRRRECFVLLIARSDLYPFFFSLPLLGVHHCHPQNDESNCTRGKRCVMNAALPEFTYTHTHAQW